MKADSGSPLSPLQPPSADSGRKTLEKLYRELTQELARKIGNRMGRTSGEIREYSRALKKDLSGFPTSTPRIQNRIFPREHLLQQILQSHVVLVGDFHPHPQTQREFLRWIREIHPALGTRRLIIGLEFVSQEHQPLLDRFMQGKLTDQALLSHLRFEEKWGISHASFRSLLLFLRTLRGTELLALNAPEELQQHKPLEMSDLEYRDRWCAGVIVEALQRLQERGSPALPPNQSPLMLCLYGELHLASAHLPRELRTLSRKTFGKPLESLIIHQNLEGIYWKLMRARLEEDAWIVQLKKTPQPSYCLFSSPPWTRLQSVLDWLETSHGEESELDDFDDFDEDEEQTDGLSQFAEAHRFLSKALGIPEDPLDDLEVYLSHDLLTVSEKLKRAPLPQSEIRWHHFRLRKGEKLSIPEIGLLFIPAPASPHRFAELCGERIFRKHASFQRTHLEHQILEASFAYFCSKLVNPRRKCDLPSDHLKQIQLLQNGEREERFEGEKEARLKVHDYLQGLLLNTRSSNRTPGSLRERYSLMRFCSWTGKTLGAAAHSALARGHTSLHQIIAIHLRSRSHHDALIQLHSLLISEFSTQHPSSVPTLDSSASKNSPGADNGTGTD